MATLTLFTAPKPFTNPHINIIQRNALRSWLALGELVEVVMIGNEAGMAQVSQEFGIRHLPDVQTNALGTPLLNSIFALARSVNDSSFLAYINADIVLLPGFLESLQKIAEQKRKFLVVGQRLDLDIKKLLSFDKGWVDEITALIHSEGKLHPKAGSDYFIYPRSCFKEIPAFAVGRAGWDNWMIYHARKSGWAVVDATQAIRIMHQNHDYSHLPGGQPHYKLAETNENVILAGGKFAIFTLDDVNYEFDGKKVRRAKMGWKKFWREVEIFPGIVLKSKLLTNLSQAVFHPRDAYACLRQWVLRGSQKGVG